jgi:hypothetical protein
VNGRVLFFTFGICVLTGLVFGLIPAYRASQNDPNECLREGGRSTATKFRHRTRNILVVAEIAVALVSLICAGLMINTVTRILLTSPGFDPDHLFTAEVRMTGEKYMDATDQEKTGLNLIKPPAGIFCRRVLERLRNTPGIEDAALVDWLPLAEKRRACLSGLHHCRQERRCFVGKTQRHARCCQCGLFSVDGDSDSERPRHYGARHRNIGAGGRN